MDGNYFIEGHDSGNVYWIQPVLVTISNNVTNIDEEFLQYEISVDADVFNRYFKKFFLKYFEANMLENRSRYTKANLDKGEYLNNFDDVLEHNFYTVDQIRAVIADIDEVYKGFFDFSDCVRKMCDKCKKNNLISVMGP